MASQAGLKVDIGQKGFLCVVLLSCILGGCSTATNDPDPASAREYVGDETCAACHEDLYQSFHTTGMGMSLSQFADSTAVESFPSPEIYNDKFDFYYRAHRRGDSLFQKEYRKDQAGTVVHELEYPVEWVIGSGNATRSYLMNVNGFVSEMPLTWYSESARWDMSPSYRDKNFRFSRRIPVDCMTCHNGLPGSTPGVLGHYDVVPLGITCERCHGAGSEHVDNRLEGREPAEDGDDWIVELAELPRSEQLSICQQCHLSGISVYAVGESPATFRPGQPLSAHRSVFVNSEDLEDEERFGIASHAQRLSQSECFKESAMTCTTCHDPHRPVSSLGADYFNSVCSSCHAADGGSLGLCSRDESATAEQAMTGDCVSCHMRKSGTDDIPHVKFTDHWIRKELPAAQGEEEIDRNPIRTDPLRLVQTVEPPTHEPGSEARSRALAYFEWYRTKHALEAYLDSVIVYAESAATSGSYDSELALAYGRAQFAKGRTPKAESILQNGLRSDTNSVELAFHLALVQLASDGVEAAEASLRRAIRIQPLHLDAQLALGKLLYDQKRPEEAEQFFQFVIEQNPTHFPEAWNSLGLVQLVEGDAENAVRSLTEAVRLDPDRPLTWVNLGGAYLLSADLVEAEKSFLRAIQLDAMMPAPYGNLGLIYLERGERSKAKAMFEQLLSINPNDENARRLLAQIQDV